MRNLKITVNGKTYDVQVEEVEAAALATGTQPAVSSPTAAPTPLPVPQAAVPEKQETPAVPAPAATGEAKETVESPMPGTILKVNVNAGDAVKKGDVLVVLEAMKMENNITAVTDAVVVGVHVAQGSMVDSGDPLVSINY